MWELSEILDRIILYRVILYKSVAGRSANIELSPVWDTSCLAEIIYNLINWQFMQEVSQTGDD